MFRKVAALVALMSTISACGAWPTSRGQTKVSSTIEVRGVMDGKNFTFYGIGDGSQNEKQPAMFKLLDNAVLKNVIVGAPAGDGVHCMGSCTLENVWWPDVGEDAATFKSTNAKQTMLVKGGGAKFADDKVFQHNGPGTMIIDGFIAENCGKLYRACGNCKQRFDRHVIVRNVVTKNVKTLAGINVNYGDTAEIYNSVMFGKNAVPCKLFRAASPGSEPKYLGPGDGKSNGCKYSKDVKAMA